MALKGWPKEATPFGDTHMALKDGRKEEIMDVVEGLMRFGLTRQESMLYIHLLSGGAMTGYEAAKATGISRSNAYTALAALTDKGAACAADGTPTRYMAVHAGRNFWKVRSAVWSA